MLAFVGLASTAPLDNVDFTQTNQFGLRLLDNTYSFQDNFGKKNIAISPISVWSIFSLLAEGSSGDTFLELIEQLGLPKELKSTQALHLAAKQILQSDDRDATLKGQSAMFTDCTLKVHPEFCQSATLYSTDIYSVDPTNTTKLAGDINYYICIATDGKIINAVRPENLENLRMALVDVLYFKANWTHPFDPTLTREEQFYNSQGKTIGSVNMMYHKAPHNLFDVPEIGAQVLEMTYGRNKQFAMLILLPFDGMPLKRLLSNLASQPSRWLASYRADEDFPNIDCYIPRFVMSSQLDLIPPLQYTGIHTIFDSKKAELPGVSASPLFVSSTTQSVELEVTEEGTVAAASTVVGLEDRLLGQRFEANKEFVFLIIERRSNLILFSGVYGEPSVI